MLAKIRAAQQRHFDENIEGEDDSDSDSTSDAEQDGLEVLTQPQGWGHAKHAERLIRKAKNSTDGKIRFERRGRHNSVFDKTDRRARGLDPRDYDFPFRNVVLEGGGNKGMAYCGAIRVSGVWSVVVSGVWWSAVCGGQWCVVVDRGVVWWSVVCGQ